MVIDIKKIARLAEIELSEAEQQQYTADLAEMAKMVDALPDIQFDGIIGLNPAKPMRTYRSDVIIPSTPREELLALAPSAVAGCYAVPKLID